MRTPQRYSILLALSLVNACVLTDAANASSQKPTKCPSVSALQTIRIQKNDLFEIKPGRWTCCNANGFPYYVDGTWGMRKFVSHYDTNDKWAFSLHEIQANSAEESLKKFNKDLYTLTFAYGPTKAMQSWYCSYFSSSGDVGVWLRD